MRHKGVIALAIAAAFGWTLLAAGCGSQSEPQPLVPGKGPQQIAPPISANRTGAPVNNLAAPPPSPAPPPK